MYASLSSIIQVAITNERTFERSGQPRYSFPDVTLSPNICDEDSAERVPERSSEGTSEFAGVARAYAVFRDLNIVIALRNCMFSGDQSDVQEFFLYVMEEISKEVESLSLNPAAVGRGGKTRTKAAFDQVDDGDIAYQLAVRDSAAKDRRNECGDES